MSCGTGHHSAEELLDGHHHGAEPGDGEPGGAAPWDEDTPGSEDWTETEGDADPWGDEDGDDTTRPPADPAVVQHRRDVMYRTAVAPAADGAVWLSHQVLGPNIGYRLLVGAVAGAVIHYVGMARAAHRQSPAMRHEAEVDTATYGPWALAAAALPGGNTALLAGQATLAPLAWWRHRRGARAENAAPPPPPAAAAPPAAAVEVRPAAPLVPPADPRLVAFRRRFVDGDAAPLCGTLTTLTEIGGRSFTIRVEFPPEAHATASTLGDLSFQRDVAKLYRTNISKVASGYVPDGDGEESEHLGSVTVTTSKAADFDGARLWDGECTVNFATGTVDIGPYVSDGTPARDQVWVPGSGTRRTLAGGEPGGGKSGALHKLAADVGQAAMCINCRRPAGQGTCGRGDCELTRVIALFLADVQGPAMGVWRGHADQTAIGPEGTVEMLELLMTIAAARSENMLHHEWWDTRNGVARRNVGLDAFDPAPGWPLIWAQVDEWWLLPNHADKQIRDAAINALVRMVGAVRKVGIHLVLAQPIPDASQLGHGDIAALMQAGNVLGFRMDRLSAVVNSISSKAASISPTDKGALYGENLPGGRPDDRIHTSWAPTYMKDDPDALVDIRELAERIAGMRIDYDAAIADSMETFGIRKGATLTRWTGRPGSPAEHLTGELGGQLGDLEAQLAANAATLSGQAPPEPPREQVTLSPQPGSLAGMVAGLEADGHLRPADPAVDPAASGPRKPEQDLGDLGMVRAVLDKKAPKSVYQVMRETGLSMGVVLNALDALVTTGLAICQGGEEYVRVA
jgi:hypothetical protein